MKECVELKITPEGIIRTMYQDGIEKFAEDMGGEVTTSCRASDVEWEEDGEHKGWTVRSAHKKSLALRVFPPEPGASPAISTFKLSDDESLRLMFFNTRDLALYHEQQNFWALLAPKHEGNDGK